MTQPPSSVRVALRALGASIASFVLASSLAAQTPHTPATGVPDIAPGAARIEGRVLYGDRTGAASDVEVILYALDDQGVPGLRGTRTDAAGVFVFDAIAGDPGTVYMIGARYRDVPFGKRVVFAAGEQQQFVELVVSDPTRDPGQLEVGGLTIRVDHGCGALRVSESVEVRNNGTQVVFVAESERSSVPPLLEIPLPVGSSDFRAPFGDPAGVQVEGDRVRFWGPIHPGSHNVEFFYALDAGAGTLQVNRPLPRGAESVEVTTPADWAAPTGAHFETAAGSALSPNARRSTLGPLAPGSDLSFTLAIAASAVARSAVEYTEAQIWLEMDDAAATVNEHHAIEVPAEAAGTPATGAPLLCIPLPRNAEALRFSPESLAMGLFPDPSGALAVQGPLKAGPVEIHFRYRLPVRGEGLHFAHRFGSEVPLLTVYVADTSLAVDSDRFHRQRAARVGERSYLHFEAFGVEPGEEVALTLTPITPAAPLPRWASGGLVAAATTGALAFLAAPLFGTRKRTESDLNPAVEAAAERESVYAAIDDADHDFETGKLDAEEHTRLRAELRARAVELLRIERASESARAASAGAASPTDSSAGTTTPGGPAAAKFCSQCGATMVAEARFCSQCGAKVAGGAAPG